MIHWALSRRISLGCLLSFLFCFYDFLNHWLVFCSWWIQFARSFLHRLLLIFRAGDRSSNFLITDQVSLLQVAHFGTVMWHLAATLWSIISISHHTRLLIHWNDLGHWRRLIYTSRSMIDTTVTYKLISVVMVSVHVTYEINVSGWERMIIYASMLSTAATSLILLLPQWLP